MSDFFFSFSNIFIFDHFIYFRDYLVAGIMKVSGGLIAFFLYFLLIEISQERLSGRQKISHEGALLFVEPEEVTKYIDFIDK